MTSQHEECNTTTESKDIKPEIRRSKARIIITSVFKASYDPKQSSQAKTEKFQRQLKTLTHQLSQQYPAQLNHPNDWYLKETETSRENFARAIDFLTEAACYYLDRNLSSFKFVDSKCWTNTAFDPALGVILRELSDYPKPQTIQLSRQRVGRLIPLLVRISSILRSNMSQTKRKMFYLDKRAYGDRQEKMDSLLDSLAGALYLPRASFHILASSKGLVSGNLTIKICAQDDSTGEKKIIVKNMDHSSEETSPIQNPAAIVDMTSTAKFCLVIEKEAIFHDMVQSEVHRKLNCLLVTGKGIPDAMTRHFVHLVWCFLRIPIFCLADGDPRGIEIMCIYRYGSLSASYDNRNLAVPQMKWLGIFPRDLTHSLYKSSFDTINSSSDHDNTISSPSDSEEEVDVDGDSSLPPPQPPLHEAYVKLSEGEVNKLKHLLKRPFMNSSPQLREQIKLMLKDGRKIGLEFLCEVGHAWLWEWYIPRKICEGDII